MSSPIDASTITRLIQEGESETLEFKARWPGASAVSKILVAFANTSGGVLLLGVGDRGQIEGLSPNEVPEALSKIQDVAASLIPQGTTVGQVAIDDKVVVFVGVERVPTGPVTMPSGQILRRIGSRIVTEKPQTQMRKCFISAESGADLNVLIRILARLNYDVVVPDRLEAGSSWSTLLRQFLAQVNLVIAALPERASENIFFELGMATALGKRALLIVPPERHGLPDDARSLLTVRAELDNEEALSFALEQLARAPSERPPTAAHGGVSGQAMGKQARLWLERLSHLPPQRSGEALEELVANLLREAGGIDVVVHPQQRDDGWDFAIWADRLEPFVGNPLIVEVKKTVRGDRIRHVVDQLSSYMERAHLHYALLLYLDGPDLRSPEWRSLPPNILPLRVDDLVRELEEKSFEEIVRNLRNERVHGLRH